MGGTLKGLPFFWCKAFVSPELDLAVFKAVLDHELVHLLYQMGYVRRDVPAATAISAYLNFQTYRDNLAPLYADIEKGIYYMRAIKDPLQRREAAIGYAKNFAEDRDSLPQEPAYSYIFGRMLAGMARELDKQTGERGYGLEYLRLLAQGADEVTAEEIARKEAKISSSPLFSPGVNNADKIDALVKTQPPRAGPKEGSLITRLKTAYAGLIFNPLFLLTIAFIGLKLFLDKGFECGNISDILFIMLPCDLYYIVERNRKAEEERKKKVKDEKERKRKEEEEKKRIKKITDKLKAISQKLKENVLSDARMQEIYDAAFEHDIREIIIKRLGTLADEGKIGQDIDAVLDDLSAALISGIDGKGQLLKGRGRFEEEDRPLIQGWLRQSGVESLVKDVLASDTFKPLDPKEQEEGYNPRPAGRAQSGGYAITAGVSARCFLAAEERQLFPEAPKSLKDPGDLVGKYTINLTAQDSGELTADSIYLSKKMDAIDKVLRQPEHNNLVIEGEPEFTSGLIENIAFKIIQARKEKKENTLPPSFQGAEILKFNLAAILGDLAQFGKYERTMRDLARGYRKRGGGRE